MPIDEMPVKYVKLYQKRKTVTDQVIKLLTADGPKRPPTKGVNIAIRKTILDFWSNMGGKELAYSDREGAAKKMAEHVKKRESKDPK